VASCTRWNRSNNESLSANHSVVTHIQITYDFRTNSNENPISNPGGCRPSASASDIRSYRNLMQNQTIISNRRQARDEYSLQAMLEPYPSAEFR
jgi:hypothetical protein